MLAQWKRIQLGTMRLQVQSLASLSGLRIWCCHVLWCRLAAVAPVRPLAWELPYAAGAARKEREREKEGERGREKEREKERKKEKVKSKRVKRLLESPNFNMGFPSPSSFL